MDSWRRKKLSRGGTFLSPAGGLATASKNGRGVRRHSTVMTVIVRRNYGAGQFLAVDDGRRPFFGGEKKIRLLKWYCTVSWECTVSAGW